MIDQRKDTDMPPYAELPRLRARLAALTTEGRTADANRVREEIRRRVTDATQAADPLITERRRLRERYRSIVQQIRELEGAIAGAAGGSDKRIRELTRQARSVNAQHERLTAQIKAIRRCVTAVDPPDR